MQYGDDLYDVFGRKIENINLSQLQKYAEFILGQDNKRLTITRHQGKVTIECQSTIPHTGIMLPVTYNFIED